MKDITDIWAAVFVALILVVISNFYPRVAGWLLLLIFVSLLINVNGTLKKLGVWG